MGTGNLLPAQRAGQIVLWYLQNYSNHQNFKGCPQDEKIKTGNEASKLLHVITKPYGTWHQLGSVQALRDQAAMWNCDEQR